MPAAVGLLMMRQMLDAELAGIIGPSTPGCPAVSGTLALAKLRIPVISSGRALQDRVTGRYLAAACVPYHVSSYW